MLEDSDIPASLDFFSREVAPKRKRILTLLAPYLPGYRSGGPVQSMSKTIQVMSPHYDFLVLTNDRDTGDKQPYQGVQFDIWQRVQNAQVYYATSLDLATIAKVIREVNPDLLYLHSFYDSLTLKALYLRKMGRIPNLPVVLAPRGEFSGGAMSLKSTKKELFRSASRVVGFHNRVVWHASSPSEKQDIVAAMAGAPVFLAQIPALLTPQEAERVSMPKPDKKKGRASLMFAARICPMKNLLYLIERLEQVSGEIDLNIFGPVEVSDRAYWDRAKEQIKKLGENVHVAYHGGVPHLDLLPAMRAAHFFVLPTLGENFCHSIAESLLCGTPVIVSDRTPWRSLQEAGVGFDLPLDNRAAWVRTLQQGVDMDQHTYERFDGAIRRYMANRSAEESCRQFNELFEYAMEHEHEKRTALQCR